MLTNQELLEILKNNLESAQNEQQAIEIKNIFVKQYVVPMMKRISNVEDKKAYGLMINEFKKEIESIFNNKINDFSTTNQIEKQNNLNDVELSTNSLKIGNHHLLNIVLNDIFKFFNSLNFSVISGNEVVEDKFNFQHLNIGIDHPARNSHDSFYINKRLPLVGSLFLVFQPSAHFKRRIAEPRLEHTPKQFIIGKTVPFQNFRHQILRVD